MKKLGRLFFGIIFCCTFNTLFSQTPLSICEITNFPINELEIVTVGIVTEIVDDDQFMLTSEGCSILCDGDRNELPWIGYKIFIKGVVEYEKIGNDLEIDSEYWLLIYDTDPPDPPPPATVFTVEDALLADIGSIAGLSGEVLEYTDTIFGIGSFMDGTGTMDMDFSTNDKPDVEQAIQVIGVVEFGNTAKEIDVSYWYYEGGSPPPESPPVAWDIASADTLPLGAFCFIYGSVSSWMNQVEGAGQFADGSDSMNIDFENVVEVLPVLGDSIYILGEVEEKGGDRVIAAYHYYEEFSGQTPISVCDIVENPENRMSVVTIGQVTDLPDNDQFVLSADGCDILCDGDVNELPEVGMNVIVEGVVETEDDGDELEIDVEYWAEYGFNPSPPPDGVVNTVAEALNANEGEAAFLTGKITEYTDPNDGISSFIDSTGTMTMDFRDGEGPDENELINVLGVIEEEDGTNEIDVSFWYYDSGEPPSGPPDYASSVDEAESLPLGTYCFILGSVTSWTDENDGEGVFDDGDNSMNINFENDVEVLPDLGDSVYVLGIIGEDIDVREIEAYYWMGKESTGVEDASALSFRIHVYPNPVSNILYIDTDERISRAIVYSIKGEIIKEINRPEISTINVSDLKSGLYVVSLYNEKEYLISKRLVKE